MAGNVALVHPYKTLHVPVPLLVDKCDLFADNPSLTAIPYHVKSNVSAADFREFVSALEGTEVNVTASNFSGLSKLSDEFHFRDMAELLSHFLECGDIEDEAVLHIRFMRQSQIRKVGLERLFALEEQMQERDREIALLKHDFSRLVQLQKLTSKGIRAIAESAVRQSKEANANIARFRSEFETLRNTLQELRESTEKVPQADTSPPTRYSKDVQRNIAQFRTEVGELRNALQQVRESTERAVQAEAESSIRHSKDTQQSIAEFRSEFEALRSSLKKVKKLAKQTKTPASPFPVVPEPAPRKTEPVQAPLPLFSRAETELPALRGTRQFSSSHGPASFASAPSPRAGWTSVIIPHVPKLFRDFRRRRFALLWRGGRDGFGTGEFHRLCDGHANTLTLIMDTDGNIFGGFTPVTWESRKWNGKDGEEDNRFKADTTLKSFLFTVKNPHNCPARKFGLNREKQGEAICCDSKQGPQFWDIGVYDRCNENSNSYTYNFGCSYNNDTGLDGDTFFTGAEDFRVKEIEVFEIIA
jgi:hypothetical protein